MGKVRTGLAQSQAAADRTMILGAIGVLSSSISGYMQSAKADIQEAKKASSQQISLAMNVLDTQLKGEFGNKVKSVLEFEARYVLLKEEEDHDQ